MSGSGWWMSEIGKRRIDGKINCIIYKSKNKKEGVMGRRKGTTVSFTRWLHWSKRTLAIE